jgi:hypothetical protein
MAKSKNNGKEDTLEESVRDLNRAQASLVQANALLTQNQAALVSLMTETRREIEEFREAPTSAFPASRRS